MAHIFVSTRKKNRTSFRTLAIQLVLFIALALFGLTTIGSSAQSQTTLTPTPFGGGHGQIAFVAEGRTYYKYVIYVMDADSSNVVHHLTDNRANSWSPVWSPDGSQIAFLSDRDGKRGLYVMDSDGSNSHQLTQSHSAQINAFAWSPDGTRIAFEVLWYGTGRGFEIDVIDADGSHLRNLTNSIRIDPQRGFAWSPDGTQIAFVYEGNIHVMDANGFSVQLVPRLTSDGGWFPTWSPDGAQIAFISSESNIYVMDADGSEMTVAVAWHTMFSVSNIYVMDADGSNVRRLTNNSSYYDYGPAWSPDGTQIAFTFNDDGYPKIYVMDADGSNIHPLNGNLVSPEYPAWSPDGKLIAFIVYDNGYDLYVSNADGTNGRRLTRDRSIYWSPAWRP